MSAKLLFLPVLVFLLLGAKMKPKVDISPPPTSTPEEHWVDSVFNNMTDQERLGQLFMIRAHSDLGEDHIKEVERQIEKYRVGGLCFFQGTPEKQVELINNYQLQSPIPLMIGMDAEWGLGMRMPGTTISYPRQLTLGAISDNRLIYKMGAEIARQLKLVGTHVNFAPVVDVNNNPKNPVINTRSFGENRYNVATKSYMYMKGMQDNGILACAKHFPGHGDTDVDSHKDLPLIPHSRQRLDSIELYPFKALIQHGVGSIMVAHLDVPALVKEENRPTTLSNSTVTQVLQREMGFEGLIFTDALEMEGVVKYYEPGEVEAEALLAGNDVLLLPVDIDASFRTINEYIDEGRLTWEDIYEKTRKILKVKYRLGLTSFKPLSTENLEEKLNAPAARATKRMLVEKSITLVRNNDQLVPFLGEDSLNIASIAIGVNTRNVFQKRIDDYFISEHYQVSKNITPALEKQLIEQTKDNNLVIVSLHNLSSFASRNYGLNQSVIDFVHRLDETKQVLLVIFGTPYSLVHFDGIGNVLVAYEENPDSEDLAAQALFGAFAIQGRLPVTASLISRFNTGVTTKKSYRFGYADPWEVGLNPDSLIRIDELANEAIKKRATPGCVVLVAKSGKIVYQKAFGHHTYQKKIALEKEHIFDLASITKIAASTVALMKLVSEGRVDLDAPISKYLPELKNTNKEELRLREVLAHIAGLKSWIPFYKQTVIGRRRRKRPSPKFFKTGPTDQFSIPVTERLFMQNEFVDTIWQQIIDSELPNVGRYRYSDLGFYIIARLVENVTQQPLDVYTNNQIYQPLHLERTTFKPWEKFSPEIIVPTEIDRYFRAQKVHGYVHDMGAAMLGGVSGHAGLFSNAKEIAVILQMILQGGQYGGVHFFSPEVIQEFTSRHPRSTRRGLGFDMLETNPSLSPNMAPEASLNTFGHLGFTGTCAWADPDHDLVYVFLSNRTYPSMYNYRISKLDTRLKIHSTIYSALVDSEPDDPL